MFPIKKVWQIQDREYKSQHYDSKNKTLKKKYLLTKFEINLSKKTKASLVNTLVQICFYVKCKKE